MKTKFLLIYNNEKTKTLEGSFQKLVNSVFYEASLKMKSVNLTPTSVFRTAWQICEQDGNLFATIIPNKND